ncbi:hypothetical protein [Oleiphilus messinensis]|uniref:hypothetical protein n=1 Tax=Oleiphilus messinensis TaxID=141451 RepID=UPI000B3BA2CC|nr:hypothetical protein [Oleiphilus messinensis]
MSIQQKLAIAFSERKRRYFLQQRYPNKFTSAGLYATHAHLFEALEWLCKAQDKSPAAGALYSSYLITGGWQTPTIISTAFSLPAFQKAGSYLKRDDLLQRSENAGEWVQKQTIDNIDDIEADSLAHAILAINHIKSTNPDCEKNIAKLGYGLSKKLEGIDSSSIPQSLTPYSLICLALARADQPVGTKLLKKCQNVDSLFNISEKCLALLAWTDLAITLNLDSDLEQIQKHVEKLMLTFERTKWLAEKPKQNTSDQYCNISGACSLSILLFSFADLANDPRYLNAAFKLNEYLKNAHFDAYVPKTEYGAMRDNDPLHLRKYGGRYSTHTTRLYIDALLAEERYFHRDQQ